MWYPFRERPARFYEEGCAIGRRGASKRKGCGEETRRQGREGWGAKESSVFLVDPPRRPLEKESSGLRRRGLFVPRRDAFGASYLRVTPCNRAPTSVFSFSPPPLSSPLFRASRFHNVITLFVDLCTVREERAQASPLHARSAFEFEEKVRSARRSAAP